MQSTARLGACNANLANFHRRLVCLYAQYASKERIRLLIRHLAIIVQEEPMHQAQGSPTALSAWPVFLVVVSDLRNV